MTKNQIEDIKSRPKASFHKFSRQKVDSMSGKFSHQKVDSMSGYSRSRKNSRHGHNRGTINTYTTQMKKNRRNFGECHQIFLHVKNILEGSNVNNLQINTSFGLAYLHSCKLSSHPYQLQFAHDFIDFLIDLNVLCDSRLYLEYIYILRLNNYMLSAKEILTQLCGLNIHRPSFKVLASVVTTYCTLAGRCRNSDHSRAMEYAHWGLYFYREMKRKYKYVPNTYLYNSVLNMFCKLKCKKLFWELVCEEAIDGKIKYDAFTYGSLLEMCLVEGNYLKMRNVFMCFEKHIDEFDYEKDEKNVNYVNSLYKKMHEMEKEEYKKNFLQRPEHSIDKWTMPIKKSDVKECFDCFKGVNLQEEECEVKKSNVINDKYGTLNMCFKRCESLDYIQSYSNEKDGFGIAICK